MVFAVFWHMFHVFYRDGYKPPHEFNWVVGVVLLLVTLFLSYTGYLLPWDQLAFWAVTVGTNIISAMPVRWQQDPVPAAWWKHRRRKRIAAFLRAPRRDSSARRFLAHRNSLLARAKGRWSDREAEG